MKKKTKIILISIITFIVILGLFKLIEERNVLYRSSQTNYSWGFYKSEKTIYNTGKITMYSKSDGKREKKTSHLTYEELNTLKELAKSAKIKMVRQNGMIFDAGDSQTNLFHPITHKKIEIYRLEAGNIYVNQDENAQKCIDMIANLFDKYFYKNDNLS